MKIIKIIILGFVISAFTSTVHADHETQILYSLASVTGYDQGTVCSAYADTRTELYDGARTYTGTLVDVFGDGTLYCETTYTTATSSTPKGLAQDPFGEQTEVIEHDSDDRYCADLEGQTFTGTYQDDVPEVTMCANTCRFEIVYQKGGAVDGYDETYWWYAGEYTGEQCTADEDRNTTKFSEDAETNSYLDEATGEYTEHPAADPPSADEDPDTEGDQPALVDETFDGGDTSAGDDMQVEKYPMEGGGDLYVVTDADGNVTFTDQIPLTGTGNYTPDYSSASGGTGDSTGDGSDGGTTSGDGTGEGDDTGDTDDGEDAEDDEGTASGGADCDVAPSCSGNAIECMIVRQNWYNRCENEEIKDILETEIEPEEITDSAPAQDIMQSIEGVEDALTDLDGDGAGALTEAATIDVDTMTGRMTSVSSSGGCSLPQMNVDVMGVQMPFGTHLCSNWGIFKTTAEFLLWAFAAITIFVMYANAMRPR